MSKWIIWLIFICGISVGFFLGMIYQQVLFANSAVKIGESIKGNTFNIEVDINETELINELNKTFTPMFKELWRESNFTYDKFPEDSIVWINQSMEEKE